MAVVQSQQQQQQPHKQPRQWSAVWQQVASRKAAGAFYVLLALGLLWFVAGGRARPAADTQPPLPAAASPLQSSTVLTALDSTSYSSSSSSRAALQPTMVSLSAAVTQVAGSSSTSSCPFGSLPGTWVSDAPVGAKWQVLDSNCQLKNWLAAYHTAAVLAGVANDDVAGGAADAAAAAGSAAGSSTTSSSTTSSTASSSTASTPTVLPFVNILLLSDSVDRYVLQHVCDYLGGVKHTVRAQHKHMQPTVEASVAAEPSGDEAQQQQQQQPTADTAAVGSSSSSSSGETPAAADPAAAASTEGGPTPSSNPAASSGAGSGPSNLNATAYAFHTCQLPESVPLKLASCYFPGVHPTGPFHRGLTQNYAARIRAAVSMWEDYAGAGQPPHVVGVASGLWDMARLWLHERQQLEGPELSRQLLDGWVGNFSSVVRFTQAQLPQTQVWLTHTTMLPAHDATTGIMTKPYLGRRYFIEQLNAAAATAARQLGLQLLDYAALSSRFREGQQYLTDLIHPNAQMALELFNLLLNMALAPRGM